VLEERSDAFPCGLDGSLGSLAQERFELCEDLLDRIEIGTVGRQEEELRSDRSKRTSDSFCFVTAEIVDDDDVAGFERGQKKLLDISAEAVAVDRSIDHAWRVDAVAAQRRKEGQSPPVSVRDLAQEPVTARRPAAQAGHVGFGPGLVDEDQPSRIKPALIGFPACAFSGDVGTILLGGEQRFF